MYATALRLSVAAGVWLACAAPIHAQTIYHLTDLGTLGGANSNALSINSAGQVVGSADTSSGTAAFLYSGGSMTSLGTLGGSQSTATGINDAGQIVGSSLLSGNMTSHAFLYSGGMLSDLTAATAGALVSANAINSSGQIAGSNSAGHAAVYNAGVVVDLGTFGGKTSVATSINSAGQVAGWSDTYYGGEETFLYSGGVTNNLATLGGNSSKAYAINASGQVAGTSDTGILVGSSMQVDAFFNDSNGMNDAGNLGGLTAAGYGVNDSGLVVGKSTTTQNPADTSYRGFIYGGADGIGQTRDLNTLVDSSASGWTITEANAINNNNLIVGSAVDSAGATHAVLLTPVPAPSFTWTNTGATGSWNSAANWSAGGPPNAMARVAIFAVTSPVGTVTLDGNQTVGVLQFNNGSSGSGMTISAGSPAGTLTLDAGIPGSSATIIVSAGQHTISAPIVLNQSANITISPGTGLTIGGPISDGGSYSGITLSGGGTLTLAGANTYAGPTIINGGTLRAGAVNTIPLPTTSLVGVTVAAGATLALNGFSQSIHSLTGSGSVTNNASDAATLTVDFVNFPSFSGVISDATSSATGELSLTLVGSDAALTLSGINKYTGATTLNGGTLTLDFTGPVTPTNIVSPASTLVLAGGTLTVADAPGSVATLQTFNGMTINALTGGTGYFNFSPPPVASTVVVSANGNTNPASALVLGVLTRAAGGSVTFTLPSIGNITTSTPNTNGIIGPWAIVNGTDWAANSGVANAAGGYNIVAYSGYTYDYTTAAATIPTTNYGWAPGNNTSTIGTNYNNTTIDLIAPGSTTNSLRFNAGPTNVTLTGANTITSGGILLTASTGYATINGSGTLTVGTAANELIVTFVNSYPLTISAAIVDNGSGTMGLTLSGSGSLTLTNPSNTYGGVTTVSGSSFLGISADRNLGPPPAVAKAGDLVLNGGVLYATASFVLNSNRGIALGEVSGLGTGSLAVASGQLLSYGGIIADNGTSISNLEFDGPGTLALTGTNTFSGGTTLYGGGVLIIGSDAALGATTANPNIDFYNGGTLQLATGFSGTMSSNRSIDADGGTIDTNGNGTSAAPIAYSGNLTINNTFTKAGAGVFELDSIPTFAGNITGNIGFAVSGGTLRLNYGGTPANLSHVSPSVAAGARLELAGSASQLSNSVNIANSGSLLVSSSVNQNVGAVTGSGNTVVNAAASLTAYQIRQNSLTINGTGVVTLLPSGSGSVSNPTAPNNTNFSGRLASLSIGGTANAWTGTLDIGNNGLVLAYGSGPDPFGTITNMVESGYASGAWTGAGITSSLARAAAALGSPTPALNIGLIDFVPNGPGFGSFILFEGQTITTSAVFIRLTYMDDLVLAGDMQFANASSDALYFAANYGTGTTWSVGDLNHDGAINTSDALLFAANYVVGLPSLDGTTGNAAAIAGNSAAAPEPASLVLAALAALALVARAVLRPLSLSLEREQGSRGQR